MKLFGRTRPERIIDKNGKATTVHRAFGRKDKSASRVSKVAVSPSYGRGLFDINLHADLDSPVTEHRGDGMPDGYLKVRANVHGVPTDYILEDSIAGNSESARIIGRIDFVSDDIATGGAGLSGLVFRGGEIHGGVKLGKMESFETAFNDIVNPPETTYLESLLKTQKEKDARG